MIKFKPKPIKDFNKDPHTGEADWCHHCECRMELKMYFPSELPYYRCKKCGRRHTKSGERLPR